MTMVMSKTHKAATYRKRNDREQAISRLASESFDARQFRLVLSGLACRFGW